MPDIDAIKFILCIYNLVYSPLVTVAPATSLLWSLNFNVNVKRKVGIILNTGTDMPIRISGFSRWAPVRTKLCSPPS